MTDKKYIYINIESNDSLKCICSLHRVISAASNYFVRLECYPCKKVASTKMNATMTFRFRWLPPRKKEFWLNMTVLNARAGIVCRFLLYVYATMERHLRNNRIQILSLNLFRKGEREQREPRAVRDTRTPGICRCVRCSASSENGQ